MMDSKGQIVTVAGNIPPEKLGITLTHEHLSCDVTKFFVPPRTSQENKMCDVGFEMKTLGWIRQNPNSHKPNLYLYDESSAITEELQLYKMNGGCSIVENTTHGIGRDVKFAQFLQSLSEKTGVNIIAGTGFYVDSFQTASDRALTEEQIAAAIRQDFTEGFNGIKVGIIGEVGTTWPITDFEKRSLRGSAVVESELGVPLMIHPGRNKEAPSEIMRIVLEAGGNARHTVMAHLDRTLIDPNELLEFAKQGTMLEYDLFGIEASHYQLDRTVDMPSDAQRIAAIKLLLDNGFEDRILMSHDVHTKHRLTKFGGHGFSHILVNIVPKMLERGITQAQVDKILQHNPSHWLTHV